MKKIFSSPAVTVIVLVLCMASPLLIDYVLYGKVQKGHIVLRYPGSTQILSTSTKAVTHTTLVGKNDCSPKYKLVTIPGGRFCSTQRVELSKEDILEWSETMNEN